MTVKFILNEWLSQTDQTNFKEGHYFVMEEAMKEYAQRKCKELLEIVAEKADIGMKKKSNYGTHRKWQNVKEDEVDLFDYQVQYFVDKDSILNVVDLEKFCS